MSHTRLFRVLLVAILLAAGYGSALGAGSEARNPALLITRPARTRTATPTRTGTAGATATRTVTATHTRTPTHTSTASRTPTRTLTPASTLASPTATRTSTAVPTLTASPTLTATTTLSKPIGAFHIWPTDFTQVAADYQMNVTLHSFGQASSMLDDLADARASGFKYVAPLYEPAGVGQPFDMNAFKAAVDGYAAYSATVASYIADGTFYAHMLFDEPCDEIKWGGSDITREQIKEASDYSKLKLPGLRTTLGSGNCLNPAQLGLLPGDVDLPTIPYHRLKGTLPAYIDQQLGYLESMGWVSPTVILNLNVIVGTPSPMPASEILSNTLYACAHPSVVMVLYWQWRGSGDLLMNTVNGDPVYQDAIQQSTAACRGT